MDIHTQKRLLRRTVLARRSRLSEPERAAAGVEAAERFLSLPEAASAGTVMCFASFGLEISTDPLVSRLLSAGRTVLMPAVVDGRMRASAISSLEEMVPGFHGIREPAEPHDDAPVADVILVPGVAFDSAGRRLGYGGGFYDVFLAAATGLTVGYCYECQIVDAVPVEPHDRSVARVVTEARVI